MTHTETNIEEEAVRRVAFLCPFCNADRISDDGMTVAYKCGSTASRAANGGHVKKCVTPIITTHWGPLC